ncbi:SDR family NAD(P)-dependent oxidoreductase [Pontibacter mangrovi]|uniref:SDR family oxidoreductase n=1 Tax=Pontibacter mangrovi TaxID=2589816 RepID=A0A501WL63_9BACT|nr:SDR family oxidoreductase [Pontibacter mangrovi]TPE46396.1 SDR family oxidoreductase [Pontibacter mangrovi]
MTHIRQAIVLVTGGASGIGKLMAEGCLQRGASHLIIWDNNSKALQEVTQALQQAGYRATGMAVDVSDTAEVEAAAQEVIGQSGVPHILFNNAGVVVGKRFEEHSYEEIRRTLNVNTLGVMAVAKAFLPGMIARGSGHIVNISSAAGLLPNPRMSVYAASKWAVLGWSESLRLELEDLHKDLHVTTVTPSYIDTGMFAGVTAPFLTPILKPEKIVKSILDAVEKNGIILRSPSIVHLLPLLRGLLPTRLFDKIVGRGFNVYTSMDHFAGRPAPEAVPGNPHTS